MKIWSLRISCEFYLWFFQLNTIIYYQLFNFIFIYFIELRSDNIFNHLEMRENGLTFNGHRYSLKNCNLKFLEYSCESENCASEIRVFCGFNKAVIKCDHNHGNENLDPVPNIVKFIHEDSEEHFAEIIIDEKKESWMFIDGFRYKKISQNKQITE